MREFWINKIKDSWWVSEKPMESQHPELSLSRVIHVREVVKIDWEKLWKEFEHWTVYCQMIGVDNPKLKIQSLVEKQLAGE